MSTSDLNAVVSLLLVFIGPCLANYPAGQEFLNCMGAGGISDGVMTGINGYEDKIAGTIDFSPNYGEEGTYVSMTISLTRGDEYVQGIELYDFSDNSSCDAYFNSDVTDMIYESSSGEWTYSDDVVLTGISAVSRYYGIGSGGKKVCVGDIVINGGPSGCTTPDWDEDGIGKGESSARGASGASSQRPAN